MSYHAEFKEVRGEDWILSIQEDNVEVAEVAVHKTEWLKINLANVSDLVGFLVRQCLKWLKANEVPGLFENLKGEVTLPAKALQIANALGISEADANIFYQTTKLTGAGVFFDWVRTTEAAHEKRPI